MTIEAATHSPMLPDAAVNSRVQVPLIHPLWVRVTHWINALAMFMMIGSGWQIYDASPLFRFIHFPSQFALGEWLAGALLWHFAAMWLLVINGIVYVTLGIVTGRFRASCCRSGRATSCEISAPRCAASSPMTIFPSTTRCSGCCISA